MRAGPLKRPVTRTSKRVSAPKTVTAGQMFRIKCQMKRNVNWRGADAMLDQKAATINAQRPVSANGNCSMRVVLRPPESRRSGHRQQNLGAVQSSG